MPGWIARITVYGMDDKTASGDGMQTRWSPVLVQRAVSEGWGGSGQVPFLLAERAR
jgi:hypothetical protein